MELKVPTAMEPAFLFMMSFIRLNEDSTYGPWNIDSAVLAMTFKVGHTL